MFEGTEDEYLNDFSRVTQSISDRALIFNYISLPLKLSIIVFCIEFYLKLFHRSIVLTIA